MQYSRKRNIIGRGILCIAVIVCLSFGVTTAWSDEEADAAREIISKWHDVVITLKVIIRQRMIAGGREMYKNEDEIEVAATIIDPSGLVVLSFSRIDPARIYNNFINQMGSGGEDTPKFKFESEITDIKMVLSDGLEVPAKLVMRDTDLDLAFVMPAEKLTKPIHALDLSRVVKPDILDYIVILTRLGKVAGRIPSISMHRIEAIVKKPRIFYVIDQNTSTDKLGAPVFSLDGKVVGVLVLRIMKSQGKGIGISSMFSGMSGLGMLYVILPAEEIASVAEQALEVNESPKDKKSESPQP